MNEPQDIVVPENHAPVPLDEHAPEKNALLVLPDIGAMVHASEHGFRAVAICFDTRGALALKDLLSQSRHARGIFKGRLIRQDVVVIAQDKTRELAGALEVCSCVRELCGRLRLCVVKTADLLDWIDAESAFVSEDIAGAPDVAGQPWIDAARRKLHARMEREQRSAT